MQDDELRDLLMRVDAALGRDAFMALNALFGRCQVAESKLDTRNREYESLERNREYWKVEAEQRGSRLDSCRRYLENVMVLNPHVSDKSLVAANALNELNGAVIHPRDVEKREQITFEGNVADMPKYPAGHHVKGSE